MKWRAGSLKKRKKTEIPYLGPLRKKERTQINIITNTECQQTGQPQGNW